MSETTKQCNLCNKIKNISEFNTKQGKCKPCQKTYQRKHYIDNKEYYSKNKKEDYLKNKDYYNEMSAKWYRENKTNHLLKCKEYYNNNKEGITTYKKEWYSRNAEKMRENTKKWYRNNTQRANLNSKKWYEENQDRIKKHRGSENAKITQRVYKNKRRLQKIQTNNGTIPMRVDHPLPIQLIDLLSAQGNKCYLCKVELSDTKQLDHWVPLSKGGTDTLDNVVWLCRTCNAKKYTKIPKTLLLV